MPLRKALFWIHLAAGTVAGLIILALAGTGFVLAWEEPVLARLEAGLRRVDPAGRRPLPLAVTLARVRDAGAQGELSGLLLRRDPSAALSLSFGREQTWYADPYSGEALGRGADRVRAWFQRVEELHRWFGFAGKGRNAAHQVKAAANLAFLALLLTGLVLWWPRAGSRAVFSLRPGLKGRARDFNWHNALGLWAWLPLLAISGTGLIMSYGWASDLLYRSAGEAPPRRLERPRLDAGRAEARPEPGRGGGRRRGPEGARNRGRGIGGAGARGPALDWERLARSAQAAVPGWRSLSLRAPRPGQGAVTVQVVTGDNPPPRDRGTLTLRVEDAGVERWEPYTAQSLGRRLRGWARWSHTGQSLGVLGEILWGLACLAALVLVYTGLALSWRRFFGGREGRPA